MCVFVGPSGLYNGVGRDPALIMESLNRAENDRPSETSIVRSYLGLGRRHGPTERNRDKILAAVGGEGLGVYMFILCLNKGYCNGDPIIKFVQDMRKASLSGLHIPWIPRM